MYTTLFERLGCEKPEGSSWRVCWVFFCLWGGDSITLSVPVGRANGKEVDYVKGEEIIDRVEGMKSETSKNEAAAIRREKQGGFGNTWLKQFQSGLFHLQSKRSLVRGSGHQEVLTASEWQSRDK